MTIITLIFSLVTISLLMVGAYASNLIIKHLLEEDSLGSTEESTALYREDLWAIGESSVVFETRDIVMKLQRMLEQVLALPQQDLSKHNYIYLHGYLDVFSDNLPQKESLLIDIDRVN